MLGTHIIQSVENSLGGSSGVRSGQQTVFHSEPFIHHLDKRSGAVGRTRGVGYHRHCLFIRVKVYTSDEHRRVLAGGADDHFFCTPRQMFLKQTKTTTNEMKIAWNRSGSIDYCNAVVSGCTKRSRVWLADPILYLGP